MQKYRFILLFPLMLLASCETSRSYYEAKNDPFIKTNYQATDALVAAANITQPLIQDAPLLDVNLVNADSMAESTGLGRIISEQVQSLLRSMVIVSST